MTDSFIRSIQSFSLGCDLNVVGEQARKCLLDYLGVTIAGSKAFFNKEEILLIRDYGTESIASVIGHSYKSSVNVAAMINGISSHAIELDDGHRIGMVHLSAPIISALLAVSEKERLATEDFLRGIVVGYEVAIRLACAIQPGCKLKGYHATGTCGTIGATMGIASALKYDYEQMKSAFSAAITSSAGLLEMIEGDSELKPYNAGRAAFDGVIAAYIGEARFKAPEDALSGRRGFLAVMTDKPKMEYLTRFEKGEYLINSIYMKPYAACRHCHPSIEAALAIRKYPGFELADIKRIHVNTYKLAVTGHDHTLIKGINSAKMSIPFSLAVALYTGKAGLNEFSDTFVHNEAVQSITNMITVSDIDSLSVLCPQKRVAEVTVSTTRGEFFKRVEYPKGEPENPLSKQEIEDKFRGLSMYSGLTLRECDQIIKEVWHKEIDICKIMSFVCK